MVSVWRPGLHHRGLGHGPGHGSWPGLPLLRSGPPKIRLEHDLGMHGLFVCRDVSVVLLGLLPRLLANRNQRVYRRPALLRPDEYAGCPQPWFSSDPKLALFLLSGPWFFLFLPFPYLTLPQMQFCAVTAAIVMGAVAERGRLLPAMVFTFIWATIVYCPLACWAWNVNGWGYKYGVMDYAGGGPVEIGSGLSALAYSMVLGRRQERMMLNFRPHNVSLILLGTVFLWFGWLGFNGGSAFGANLRATMACWNSNLAAAFAAIAWVILDWRLARKWSMVGWCSGTISGLVAATPASGFITPWGSVVLGVVTGIVCNYATKGMSTL